MTVHTLSFKLLLEDDVVRRAVLTNLEIEAVHDRTDRARVRVEEVGSHVHVEVEASDLVMLRAFTNSVFRILKTSLEVSELFG